MITVVRPPRTPQGTLVSSIVEGDVSPTDPNARARTVGPFAVFAHFDSTFGPGEAPRDLDVRPHPRRPDGVRACLRAVVASLDDMVGYQVVALARR